MPRVIAMMSNARTRQIVVRRELGPLKHRDDGRMDDIEYPLLPFRIQQTALFEIKQAREFRTVELVSDAGPRHGGERHAPIGFGSGIHNIGHHPGSRPVDQSNRNGILVREVLVQRADTDTRPFGDGVGCIARQPMSLENVSRRFQDDLDGPDGASLSSVFSET